MHDHTQNLEPPGSDDNAITGLLPGPGVPGGFNPSAQRTVEPPPPPPPSTERRHISELVQMAQLINRVEPIYPTLAIQTRHEGRVELHAIIATDGTIQSLEVLSGDPFFIQSALSAVRQWRYRPTILNDRPIEVDTHITVIYTLNH